MNEMPIAVRRIKISVPMRVEGLPGIPLDGPIGDLTLQLALEGSSLSIPARINGKSYRRMLRTVAAKGAEHVAVLLQGDVVAPSGGGLRQARLSGIPGHRQGPGHADPAGTTTVGD